MIKLFLILVVLLHGLLHLIGFYRSNSHNGVVNLNKRIPKSHGWLWLICALLFFLIGLLIYINLNGWFYFMIAALLISQVLIFISWKDARYGTIINVVILGSGIYNLMTCFSAILE